MSKPKPFARTREELAQRIVDIAWENARSEIAHAEAVAALVRKEFPDTVPARFFAGHVRNEQIAIIGKLRPPLETVRLMKQHLHNVLASMKRLPAWAR